MINVQATFLDPRTAKKHPLVAIPRQTFGSFHDPAGFHSCELFKSSSANVDFIAEGVETGLSLVHIFTKVGCVNLEMAFLSQKLELRRLIIIPFTIWTIS